MAAAGICLALAYPIPAAATPAIYVQLFMHSEEPHVPDTPNFRDMTALTAGNAASTASYIYWRNQLREYARMCSDRGIKLNFQSDWNFLEGCWKLEVKTPSPTSSPSPTTSPSSSIWKAWAMKWTRTRTKAVATLMPMWRFC